MEEIEAKFLDINVEEFKKLLEREEAIFIDSFEYKRKTYDSKDKTLAEKNAWVRLRDEGEKVTMTYKERFGVGANSLQDAGMKEIEIVVSDFNLADKFLTELGFIEKFYEENKRERYIIDNVEVDIDSWPMIPSYVELEGNSWDSLKKLANKLDLNWDNHSRCSTMQVYEKYGINENDYGVITFEEQIKK
ncbi:MAG: CYTH domain-containing protein [Candidatus Paceibacterota bacterium]